MCCRKMLQHTLNLWKSLEMYCEPPPDEWSPASAWTGIQTPTLIIVLHKEGNGGWWWWWWGRGFDKYTSDVFVYKGGGGGEEKSFPSEPTLSLHCTHTHRQWSNTIFCQNFFSFVEKIWPAVTCTSPGRGNSNSLSSFKKRNKKMFSSLNKCLLFDVSGPLRQAVITTLISTQLANSCVFTHPARTEKHSFWVVFSVTCQI